MRLDEVWTRAKLSGIRRNIAVAIGNSADEEAFDVLAGEPDREESMRDDMVREHVAWALDQARSRSTQA